MSKQEYPEYANQMLAAAEAMIVEDDFMEAEAAALCFEILALFPDHREASEMVYRACCNPQLIRDNRKAIGRHIDEWDDRPWQQRRRLALSFRFMSRWEEKYRRDDQSQEEAMPQDVGAMLQEGRSQLLQDYLLGQAQGSATAWAIFQEAIQRTAEPQATMRWIGQLYADHGYFAESVDALEMLLARFPKEAKARRLWAEARWWRDNLHRIPWIPPAGAGDGSRFRRIMSQANPDFAENEEAWTNPLDYKPPDRANLPDDFEIPALVQKELIAKIEETLAQSPPAPSQEGPVDWRYLDAWESGEIDASLFPEWAQYMLLEIDDPEQELFLKRLLLEYLSNPPLFDEDDDDEADFWSD